MGGKNKKKKSTPAVPEAENYAVERIVDERIIKGKLQYKVHWEGYNSEDETWENESQLDCPEILEEYLSSKQEEQPQPPPPPKSEKRKSNSKSNEEEETSEASHSKSKKKKEPTKEETEPSSSAIETEYQVESVTDDRVVNGVLQYKIRWVGYGSEDETWEDEDNLNCPELVKKYLKAKENKANEKKSKNNKKKVSKTKEETNNKQESASKQESTSKQETNGDNDGVKDEDGEYEVERILEMHTLKNGQRQFLVKWVGFSKKEATWEPEEHLQNTDLLQKFLDRVEEAKNTPAKELRPNRKVPDFFTPTTAAHSKRHSKRNSTKERVKYYDAE